MPRLSLGRDGKPRKPIRGHHGTPPFAFPAGSVPPTAGVAFGGVKIVRPTRQFIPGGGSPLAPPHPRALRLKGLRGHNPPRACGATLRAPLIGVSKAHITTRDTTARKKPVVFCSTTSMKFWIWLILSDSRFWLKKWKIPLFYISLDSLDSDEQFYI